MKYLVSWKTRFDGSAAENEASAARILEVYNKWAPEPDVTIHQFVLRADGQGGFAVTESDNPAAGVLTVFKLSPFVEYTVYPVLDIEEGVGLYAEAIEWRKSIT